MTKVLIAPLTLAGQGGPYADALRAAGYDLVYPPHAVQLKEDDLLSQGPGCVAIMAGAEPYTPRVFDALRGLRVVARAGVGYDAVDLKAATAHGVAVTITPGTNQDAVAEHTFALILALAKKVAFQHPLVKAGLWPRQANLPLRGRTLGIAGLGRIGKAVALRGECFKMPLLAYEPYPDRAFAALHNIRLVSFEELLAQSDYVTLHMPMTPEAKHLINKKTLALMKPTAFLVNTARGGLVCEADLYDSLKAGRLAGAALDVFEQEPVVKDNPLFTLDNIVFTPHAAGVDLQSRDDMALSAAEAIIALLRGEWPAEKVVNPDVRPHFQR